VPDQRERAVRLFWRAPDGEWTCSQPGKGVAPLGGHVAQYAKLISDLDELEDETADAEKLFRILERLAPLQRAARNLHQVLQSARKLIPADRNLIDLRDQAYEIERNAELLFSDIRNTMDFMTAHRAEQQADASHQMTVAAHRLNILAAFFFPVATLSTLFGTNLRHGLEELHPPYLFVGLIGTSLVCGVIMLLCITRRVRSG
jgi:Mg2+ and Co2+ transporter CorA